MSGQFVRCKNGKLSANQKQLLSNQLQKYIISLPTNCHELTTRVKLKDNPVNIEIGFGSGEHLLAQAKAKPQELFLGCEVFKPGLARVIRGCIQEKINNILLFEGDGLDLLKGLPSNSACQISILFPDPWPKRKHRQRRFINRSTTSIIEETLVNGGQIYFATDSPILAAWTLSEIGHAKKLTWKNQQNWQHSWINHFTTRYELKALTSNRNIGYFTFEKS